MNRMSISETMARAKEHQVLKPCVIKETLPTLEERRVEPRFASDQTDLDTVAIYTRQLKNVACLSTEDEKRLCKAIKQHEREIGGSITRWFDVIENQLQLRSNLVGIKKDLHKTCSMTYCFSHDGSCRLKGSLLRFEKVHALKKELERIKSHLSKSREKIPNLADWRETKEKGEEEISKIISQMKLDDQTVERGLHQIKMEATREGKNANGWEEIRTELETILTDIQGNLQQIRKTKNELIQSSLFLVIRMAKKYSNRGMDLPDLIQEGNQGLIRAVDTFDYRRGNRFISYAIWWVRQSIIRAIHNQSRTMRVPIYVFDKQRHYLHAAKKVSQEKGREATLKELASEMKMSIDHVMEINRAFKIPLHLDECGLFQKEMEAENIGNDPIFRLVAQSDLEKKVESVLDDLSHREREVIKMRFGINGTCCEHSLQDIGRKFSLSRERIRQIERAALIKLRKMKDVEELRGFLS